MKNIIYFIITAIIPFTNGLLAEQNVMILLGPPGSGKGTQAVNISQEKNIPHISMGDLFRENIQQETALGKTAQEYMHQGQLVPDALVIEMLLARVSQEDCQKGCLIDGFPKTPEQAIAFEKQLSDQMAVKRISGRESCSDYETIDKLCNLIFACLFAYIIWRYRQALASLRKLHH